MSAITSMKKSTFARLAVVLAVLIAAIAVLVRGTASFSELPAIDDLTAGPTYRVDVQFSNALNLPDKATILLDGVKVGVVDSVSVGSVTDSYVTAHLAIRNEYRIPVGTKVQLRQPTLLGDIFLALDTGGIAPGAPPLEPGAVIPLRDTQPPTQVEDLLVNVAAVTGNGVISKMLNTVAAANNIGGTPAETAASMKELRRQLTDLGSYPQDLGALLTTLESGTAALRASGPALSALLDPAGVKTTVAVVGSLVNAVGILGAIGPIGREANFLSGFLASADHALKAFVPAILDSPQLISLRTPTNATRLIDLILQKVVPWASTGMSVNLAELTVSDTAAGTTTRDRVSNLVSTMMRLGMAG
ncbi:Mce family protein [Gordonia effusa NBRC 100432]|uniref:Mce family protein n=1 Tax=Gordonia effusa NBRC 100432 TaxID=1077974 RepID=H0R403_9ACTN|nr:MlaD family protein [Gordonia effusa]GAB19804.1 Mce family protein [Gordonia effusa NBRC 100432]